MVRRYQPEGVGERLLELAKTVVGDDRPVDHQEKDHFEEIMASLMRIARMKASEDDLNDISREGPKAGWVRLNNLQELFRMSTAGALISVSNPRCLPKWATIIPVHDDLPTV